MYLFDDLSETFYRYNDNDNQDTPSQRLHPFNLTQEIIDFIYTKKFLCLKKYS